MIKIGVLPSARDCRSPYGRCAICGFFAQANVLLVPVGKLKPGAVLPGTFVHLQCVRPS